MLLYIPSLPNSEVPSWVLLFSFQSHVEHAIGFVENDMGGARKIEIAQLEVRIKRPGVATMMSAPWEKALRPWSKSDNELLSDTVHSPSS